MCGMILSTKYIIRAPINMPMQHSQTDERLILSGISFRKDIASITPAANASMLYIIRLEGLFITPIREPRIGPKKLINKIM